MAKKPQIDNFVPRRSTGMIGGALHDGGQPQPSTPGALKRRGPTGTTAAAHAKHGVQGLAQSEHGLSRVSSPEAGGIRRSDVDESLREIDQQDQTDSEHKKRGGVYSRRRLIIRTAILFVLISGIVAVGWLGAKTLLASSAVFNGDIFGLIQQKQLQQDAKGRTNILVVGTSEDDPGHQGGDLTDSIMVLSVDQKNKNAYMVSIPRDLYAKFGMTCIQGNAGKINQFFSCVDDGTDKAAEDNRQSASRKLFGDIVGLDVQYSVHVNYSVMRDVVNAVGPITVNIQGSEGDPGVMDSNFDWKCKGGNAYASLSVMRKNCPPNGHFIEYPNGPATLDAEHALYLAQARGDVVPTYGLSNSNFDRELNQQKIIVAIKEKATSSGTLSDISKVTKLIDAIGNNLRTNFETSEIRTLAGLAKDIPSSAIHSVNLRDATPALFGSDGAENVVPSAGTFDYSAIQAFIQKNINATPLSREDAHVVVLNASGAAGAAQREAEKLTALGMTVDSVGNAPSGVTANTVYQLKSGNKQPATIAKLQTLYNTTVKVTAEPPVSVLDTTDIVIIVVTPTVASDASARNN